MRKLHDFSGQQMSASPGRQEGDGVVLGDPDQPSNPVGAKLAGGDPSADRSAGDFEPFGELFDGQEHQAAVGLGHVRISLG